MEILQGSDKLASVHSDIRGPIFLEALRMQEEGQKVLKLNTGNPGTFGFTMPESVKKALMENMDKAVPYCDYRGMPEAREAIYAYHISRGFRNITPNDIFIGNGVSELTQMALLSLLNYGDEILLPCPNYSLWSNCTYIAGAKPVYYTCDEQSGWNPDIADIKKKITPKTRAIVVINPNNPTGTVYAKEFLEDIIRLACEHNLVVFSDEIYDRLVLDDKEFYSLASLAPDDLTVITTNGLSKSHCICGFRCGWLVISGNRERNRGFIEGMTKLATMRLCSNALTQLVVPAALADSESTRAMLVPGGRLYEQREAAMRAISQIDGLSCVKNQAAFYIFPKIDVKRFGITDDRRFALDLLHATNILIVPGSGFDWQEPDHFRVVMLPEAHILEKALLDIGAFLQTYRQK
ncbi:MAG: aminotransferase class I/II-fold pyridoxal phosphate-dependent enzyme [Clostridia bacterium]|nr:aminotransferase class I/II-fold pyridoxal phosphate-dependent enzyme [Clostridia bacterium]